MGRDASARMTDIFAPGIKATFRSLGFYRASRRVYTRTSVASERASEPTTTTTTAMRTRTVVAAGGEHRSTPSPPPSYNPDYIVRPPATESLPRRSLLYRSLYLSLPFHLSFHSSALSSLSPLTCERNKDAPYDNATAASTRERLYRAFLDEREAYFPRRNLVLS